MAISTTYFTQGVNTQKAEVYAWLQENAADYFDTISEESGAITCSLSNGASVQFYASNKLLTVTLSNQTSKSSYGSSTGYFKSGIVTSSGIMLIGHSTISSSSDIRANSIAITRTNEESVGISCHIMNNTSTTELITADLTNDSNFTFFGGATSTSSTNQASSGMTSLAPVAFGNDHTYAPNLFFVPYSQFTVPCSFELEEVKYAYDGHFALKE